MKKRNLCKECVLRKATKAPRFKCIKAENFRNQWPAFTGNQNSGPVLDVEKQIVKLLLVLCLSASFLFLSCFLFSFFLSPPSFPSNLPSFLFSSLLRRIFKTHTRNHRLGNSVSKAVLIPYQPLFDLSVDTDMLICEAFQDYINLSDSSGNTSESWLQSFFHPNPKTIH